MKFYKNILIISCIFSCFFKVIYAVNFITFAPDDIKYGNFIISDSGGYTFYNNMEYTYDPLSTASMIKIVTSDVIVDFNHIGITNISNISDALVAIEVGWSPEELAADPARLQPKNITLKNVSLNSFDCAVVVHQGVSRITLENINISDTCVSVIFAGTASNGIEEVNLSSFSMFGDDEQNHHACIVALKTLIETTYGYGSDYFNKLVADPFNGDTVDVYTYYGFWFNNVFKLIMKDIFIKDIGYKYTQGSEGNGNRTQAVGLVIKNSKKVDIFKAVIHDIYSEIKASSILLDNSCGIRIKKSNLSYNLGGKRAVGIEVTNETAVAYSVTALEVEDIEVEGHRSDDTALGMDLSSIRGLVLNNVSGKFNQGALKSYGLYIDKGYTLQIKNSTFSENIATRTTNDVATTNGITAYGFYGNNINGMQFYGTTCNNMQALNSAYGMYISNSASLLFTDCQFVANAATQMRSGEAAAIRSAQDAAEISKYAPTVDAASTGAYGVFMTSTNNIKFEKCLANSNTGHRAMGFNFKNCRSVAVYDTFASTQYATGYMLDATFQTDNIANPKAIEIKPAHIPLLFGGQSKTTVDAIAATDLFLEKMSSIRAAQVAGDDPSYSDLVAVTATTTLLESMIARYRLWSVGIGIHANNVTGFLLKNCSCAGNLSLFDNGIGICFTGRNANHSVSDSNLVFNIGNFASVITKATNPSAEYTYSYNLMGMKPFWSTLLQTDVWTNISDNSMGAAINSVALSPDGNYLAVGLANNDIKILNPNTGATIATLSGHTAAITSVAFSPDGTKLATGSASATDNIKIWNITGWTNTQTLTHTGTSVNALVFNPASTQLASGTSAATDNLVVWQVSDWSTLTSKTHSLTGVLSVAYSADGTMLASGADDTSDNIKIWATSGWTNTQTLNQHTNAVTSLAFNPAGTLLASASKDDLIKIWSTSGWTVSQTITASAGDVNAVGFKNDGKLLASAHADNSLRVWSTTDWSSVQTFTDHTQAATSLAWSTDGRRIVSGSLDGYAKFYSTNIFSKATTTTDVGIYNPSIYFTAQGQKTYGNESAGNDVFIRLKSQDRALISPVGPIGAGVVMGDLLIEGVVQNCSLYANLGNAGYCSGVILDNSYSVTIDSNLISGNIANIYGVAAGIQDRTAHSPNLFMKNFLEGNKCSTFNNSNYFVPFNPADVNNLSFPLTRMMNGKFLNVTTLMDNIEVLYSLNPQFYSIEYLASVPQHPDLVSYWTTNNCWA